MSPPTLCALVLVHGGDGCAVAVEGMHDYKFLSVEFCAFDNFGRFVGKDVSKRSGEVKSCPSSRQREHVCETD